MSTKIGIYFDDKTKTYLYEECMSFVDGIDSPAYIEVGREHFKIVHEFADKNPEVTIEIDAEIMDKLAIAWCKHRNLQGALGGPVGKEFGGPDCEYK
tara:strand:+ start:1469 stop:1759 length:291 start_codon:yes stop_codon:yes gene_type:complete